MCGGCCECVWRVAVGSVLVANMLVSSPRGGGVWGVVSVCGGCLLVVCWLCD